ncbi:riboflavin biosynthesis protein [Clostridia bacterium]|nr:riboflavin biosynthesis protein [Clostridia bacterium]
MMEIFTRNDQIRDIGPTSVALGFFDGVHLGHRVLLKNCISYAASVGTASAVFTFRESPTNVLSGTNKVKRLLSEADRNRVFEALGIDYLFEFDFADGFHKMTPEVFARDLLHNSFGARAAFCGFNFRFGARAQADPEILKHLGREYGFETFVTEPVETGGKPVSSTRIRALVEKGKIEEANGLLGVNFRLSGKVRHGAARGRTIGFPTANFNPDPGMVCPAYGVYVTAARIPDESKPLPAVTNIGVKPTVGGTELLVETHIIDYENDLYGKDIEVAFLQHLRAERKFDRFEQLKHQITEDKAAAEAYFFK